LKLFNSRQIINPAEELSINIKTALENEYKKIAEEDPELGAIINTQSEPTIEQFFQNEINKIEKGESNG